MKDKEFIKNSMLLAQGALHTIDKKNTKIERIIRLLEIAQEKLEKF